MSDANCTRSRSASARCYLDCPTLLPCECVSLCRAQHRRRTTRVLAHVAMARTMVAGNAGQRGHGARGAAPPWRVVSWQFLGAAGALWSRGGFVAVLVVALLAVSALARLASMLSVRWRAPAFDPRAVLFAGSCAAAFFVVSAVIAVATNALLLPTAVPRGYDRPA